MHNIRHDAIEAIQPSYGLRFAMVLILFPASYSVFFSEVHSVACLQTPVLVVLIDIVGLSTHRTLIPLSLQHVTSRIGVPPHPKLLSNFLT